MSYSLSQIEDIIIKADKTLYKIGEIAYEDMFSENSEALDYERDRIFIYKKAAEWGDQFYVGYTELDKIVERLASKLAIYDYGTLNPLYSNIVISDTINVSGYVSSTRKITINGLTQDLSADRTWTVGDMNTSVYDTDADGTVDDAERIPIIARNSTGVTLYKGTIVYLSGSTGNRPNAIKAQANAEATSSGTFGVVVADIANNSDGKVAAIGTLHDLDTRSSATHPFTADTLIDGDILWLDPNNAGYVTRTKPHAPNHAVYIGIVARTHPTLGRIVYRIVNGFELDELHNVDALAPNNNDTIVYNSTTLLWEHKPITLDIISGFPTQSGNAGKFLTTDGSTLSWGTVVSSNIYTADGTLAGNRTVTMGSYTLSFEKDITVYGINIGRGGSGVSTNISFGSSVLASNTTGFSNIGIGYLAFSSSVNANTSIAIGSQALKNGVSTSASVAIGAFAMFSTTGSNWNTAVGTSSLYSNLTGNGNSAFGRYSLYATTGSYNTGIGWQAGYNITSGTYNTILGVATGYGITTGSYNTVIGSQVTGLTATLSNNIILADGQGNIRIRAFDTGNVTINSATDAGYKFDVTGTSRFTDVARFENAVEFRSTTGNNKFTIASSSNWNTVINYGSWGSAAIKFIDNQTAGMLLGAASDSIDGNASIDLRNNSTGLFLNRGTIATMPNLSTNSLTSVSIVGGSGYTNGSYTGVSATGNFSGSIVVNVTISGGSLTAVSYYGGAVKTQVGETFTIPSASIGGTGSGCSFTITSLTSNSPAFTFYNTTTNRITYWNGTNYATPIVSILDRVSIGSNSIANSSSVLELTSTTQGFLPPRMTGAQVEAISTPATGLMAYATSAGAGSVTAAGWWGYDGSAWTKVNGGGANIYNADGTLTGNRIVSTTSGYTLTFNPKTTFIPTIASGDGTTIKTNAVSQTGGTTALVLEYVGTGGAFSNKLVSYRNNGTEMGYLFSNDGTAANTRFYLNGFVEATQQGRFGSVSASGTTIQIEAPGGQMGILNSQGTGGFALQYAGTSNLKMFSTGNFVIQNGGTFTDAGYKLDVQGTLRTSSYAYINYDGNDGLYIDKTRIYRNYYSNTFGNIAFPNAVAIPQLGNVVGVVISGGGGGTDAYYNLKNYPGGLNINYFGSTPSTLSLNAALQVDSTTRGFLPTVMTNAQKSKINLGIQTITTTAGSGYTDGTYTNQQLYGGNGYGAYATIVISGGSITSATITRVGINYVVGDQLYLPSYIWGSGVGGFIVVASVYSPSVGLQTYQSDSTEGYYVNTSVGWKRFLTEADSVSRFVQTFTATAGQTLFTSSNTLVSGYYDVFLNGVRISDFTATTNTITLTDACVVNDIVDIIGFQSNSLALGQAQNAAITLFNYYNFT